MFFTALTISFVVVQDVEKRFLVLVENGWKRCHIYSTDISTSLQISHTENILINTRAMTTMNWYSVLTVHPFKVQIEWWNFNANLCSITFIRNAQRTLVPNISIKFISNKSSPNNNGRIILRLEENNISEPANVAEILNIYYSSLAQYKHEHDGLDTTD